jgi:hypothetical protein
MNFGAHKSFFYHAPIFTQHHQSYINSHLGGGHAHTHVIALFITNVHSVPPPAVEYQLLHACATTVRRPRCANNRVRQKHTSITPRTRDLEVCAYSCLFLSSSCCPLDGRNHAWCLWKLDACGLASPPSRSFLRHNPIVYATHTSSYRTRSLKPTAFICHLVLRGHWVEVSVERRWFLCSTSSTSKGG